ncbi:CCCH zinc finger and SMR domain protein [Cladophialophora carrionii]|uniref:CCCH zinc finger and SMR domain protein n=1 Tax=Cladophialophora carrionii TaxID=86049 RepID=A0A1C1CIN8_9EURO|nr:CCCH zinc finger and SMR domain protein [Cladophialophora carrionii]
MISDEQYDQCRPVLQDAAIEEEEKIERLEELLGKEYGLKGSALENAVLDALWKHRNAQRGESAETPLRHHVIRKSSPAPWQVNRAPTPLGSPPPLSSSPAMSAGFPASRPSFSRQKSSMQSPFVSPRPSPRLAMAQPIPHSPSLNAYEFSDASPAPDIYGDYGHENVDWLLADETGSNAPSTATGGLSAAAPEWVPQPDMSPYDILRSVLGDRKTDDEIEQALNKNSYDLGATIASLLGTDTADQQYTGVPSTEAAVLVGKSMAVHPVRPASPSTHKSPIVCKYWLASGSCLRADCRFAHDTSAYLCKYWMNGNCLAGDACQFSHDPALLVNQVTLGDSTAIQAFQLQDQYDQFPALGHPNARSALQAGLIAGNTFVPANPKNRGTLGLGPGSRPHSRPNSRHQNRPETPSSLSMDDPDAFPTLGSAKRGTKHHGHRSRHGHGSAEKETPSSLADVVRMSPSPALGQQRKVETGRKIRTYGGSESAAARKIPEPQHIPWLETGARANQQYLKYRQEAIKHGSIRNKFLQSAAQAWNRNDARAAKALSLRGQAENDAMRKAHREAAKALYEERNKHLSTSRVDDDEELYIDLHGLHPEEAVEYLENILLSHSNTGRRIIYAITGTGHHSKNGKDKVGKGVRNWLNEWGYTFREFSVPGERGGYIGGVLGIDITSHRRQPVSADEKTEGEENASPTPAVATAVGTKIQVLKRDEVPA